MRLIKRVKISSFVVYLVIESAFIFFSIFNSFKNTTYLWLLLSEVILLIMTIFNREKLMSFFSPLSIFLIACHLSFTIKSINILEIEKFSDEAVSTAMSWYVVFLAGVFLTLKLKTRKKVFSWYNSVSEKELNYNKLKFFSIIFLPLCLVAYFVTLNTTDLGSIFNSLLANRVTMQNNGGLYTQTIITLPLKIIVYALFIKIIKNKKKASFGLKMGFAAIFALLEIIAFSLGGRGEIIFPLLALLFIYEKLKNKIDYKKIVLIFIAIIAFSGWYGLVRDGANNNEISAGSSIQNVLDRYVQLDNLIRFSSDPVDIKVGQSFYDFIASPIPRNLLPNKSYPFNSQMTSIYLPEQFSKKIVSDFTAISELYYNFGHVGIFVGGLVFGIFINYLSYLFIHSKRTFFLIFYPFLMLKPMSIFYGGMINSTVNMMLILETVLVLIVWFFVSDRPKKNIQELSI